MTQEIDYKRYHKPLMSYDEYFTAVFGTAKPPLSQKSMDKKYEEYSCKHIVFNRDNFKCQVKDCTFTNSPISIHHYKHKMNGGKWLPRNCITVCRAHQNQYHKARNVLTFVDSEELPPRISGRTQATHQYVEKQKYNPQTVSYITKQERYNYKQVRKNNREHWNRRLTVTEIVILFAWLFGWSYSQPKPTFC